MEFVIDNTNIEQFINNENTICIDNNFLSINNLTENTILIIKDITNEKLQINIRQKENSNFTIQELRILNITLANIVIINCTVNKIILDNIIQSNFILNSLIKALVIRDINCIQLKIENCIFSRQLTIKDSKIETFFIIKSLINEYLLISQIKSNNSLAFINSEFKRQLKIYGGDLNKVFFNGCQLVSIIILNTNINFKINTLIIKFSNIKIGFSVQKTAQISSINIINVVFEDSLSIDSQDAYISLFFPENLQKTTLTIDNVVFKKQLLIENFNSNLDIIINRSSFDEGLKINTNSLILHKLSISNTVVNKYFYLTTPNEFYYIYFFLLKGNIYKGLTIFNKIGGFKQFYIYQCSFERFNSIASRIFFWNKEKKYINTFELTDLKNFIFEKVDFYNISFINFDIKNATFKSCKWQEENTKFYTRKLVIDETDLDLTDLANLKKLKKIYADFKTNFQEKGDFINAGQFYISEQTIKRRIARLGGWREFPDRAVLFLHNLLSVYGESLSKNLFIIILYIALFTGFYLFAEFSVSGTKINYDWGIEYISFPNCDTFYNIFNALMLSLKNLFPFSLNVSYISIEKDCIATQRLEILQKIISFIIWASLGQTIAKYLKK